MPPGLLRYGVTVAQPPSLAVLPLETKAKMTPVLRVVSHLKKSRLMPLKKYKGQPQGRVVILLTNPALVANA